MVKLLYLSNPVLIINIKKERVKEGEKKPAPPLLKTLEDLLHNKAKQKKRTSA